MAGDGEWYLLVLDFRRQQLTITADYSYWTYMPTKGVSIVFAVLFAISGVLHVWQNVLKYRSWRIGSLLPWSAALFVAGFILREASTPASPNPVPGLAEASSISGCPEAG